MLNFDARKKGHFPVDFCCRDLIVKGWAQPQSRNHSIRPFPFFIPIFHSHSSCLSGGASQACPNTQTTFPLSLSQHHTLGPIVVYCSQPLLMSPDFPTSAFHSTHMTGPFWRIFPFFWEHSPTEISIHVRSIQECLWCSEILLFKKT